jgi:hypothetical protein
VGGDGTGNSAAQAGEGGSGGQCFGCASGGGDFGTLTLQPPAVTIEVVDGVAVPVDFNAFVGDQEVLPSGWVVDLSGIAGTDGDGVVTATGNVGGLVTLTATYGNRLTGGSGSVKQLWVAAVDADPTNGVDPSHPAFLIPGQDLTTLNMRGFWALDPCKQVGASCEQGSECCNSNCEEGICTEPDPDGCSQNGAACMEDADCCDPTATCNPTTLTCGNVPQ